MMEVKKVAEEWEIWDEEEEAARSEEEANVLWIDELTSNFSGYDE